MNSFGIKAERLQEFPKENPSSSRMKIAAGIMAISRMAPADQNRIGTIFEGFNNQVKVNPAGARQTDDSQVRRIRQSARTGEVGTKIGTPIAYKGNDFWFKGIPFNHTSYFCSGAEKCQARTLGRNDFGNTRC